MPPAKPFRLSEFAAHSSNVNCVHIGRKSGRVLATGGDDKLVNVWAIGRPNSIMSLTGLPSAVDCVSFDGSEDHLVAGGASGVLKLWDLEQGKGVRTLTGHKTNTTTVDFHPYGEFFASGSLDTNIKVWDVRRKAAIQTYRGHTDRVNTVRFSPDGRWLISGGEDGSIKLWDLTAGKLLHDFKAHQGGVTAVDFHPGEFMLASGSADRTVKFWDLEQFSVTCSTEPEGTAVRSIVFAPDGNALLSGSGESLKVYGWEPVRLYDSLPVQWPRLSDMNVSAGQVVGVATSQAFVTVWVVDLQSMMPFKRGSRSEPPGEPRSKPTPPWVNDQPEPPTPVTEAVAPVPTVAVDLTQPPVESFRVQEPPERPADDDAPSKPVTHPSTPLARGPSLEGLPSTPVAHARRKIVPANREHPAGIAVETFMPSSASFLTDEQIMTELLRKHDSVTAVISSRLTNLRAVRGMWAKGDVAGAVAVMGRSGDPGVQVDVISVLVQKPSLLTLDLCLVLLPTVNSLLSSEYEDYLLVALKMAVALGKGFVPMIGDARSQSSPGVDITREERLAKCNHARELFLKTKDLLPMLEKVSGSGSVPRLAREVGGILMVLS